MFGLLIKHEVTALWKNLRLLWCSALLAYLSATAMMLLNNNLISTLSTFVSILAILAFPLGTVVIIALRYFHTMAGKEAYFTHTLPCTSGQIFWAKFAVAFLIQLFSFGVYLLLFYLHVRIKLASSMQGLPLSSSYELAGQAIFRTLPFNTSPLAWLILIGLLFFATAYVIIGIFFSIAKGSEAPFHRFGNGGPIIVYVALYMLQQLLTVVTMLFIPIALRLNSSGSLRFSLVFESTLSNFTNLFSPDYPTRSLIGIGFVPFILISTVLLFVLTIRSHRKHTSVR